MALTAMKKLLVEELTNYLREKQDVMNPRFDFVDSFSPNSECTQITLLSKEFPFMIHIHYYDIIDKYEIKMNVIELQEEIDMALWFMLNPKYNMFSNIVAKQIVDNIPIFAEEFNKYVNNN